MYHITLKEGYMEINLTVPDRETAIGIMFDIVDYMPPGAKICIDKIEEAQN